MNHPLNAAYDPPTSAVRAIPWTQTLYWSIRRELWENRSIYIAPLVAALLMLTGYAMTLRYFARHATADAAFNASDLIIDLVSPFTHAVWLIMATALVVGIGYSLGALHNERSDRSILFWKSLPVSDLITVLAKASIPLLILPAIVVVLTFVLQLLLLLLGTAALAAYGGGAATLWNTLPWFQLELGFLYELVVLVLWLAPIYAWFLLVSGWARRTPFLWAVLPPVALCILERIVFHTTYVCSLLRDRLVGFVPRAFDWFGPDVRRDHAHLMVNVHFFLWSDASPGRFLSTPGLWLGLAVAAALLFAAARQRRVREPI